MSTQVIIRLDTETKNKLTKLAKSEGKNSSQVIRELIQNYIQEHDMAGYIDDLWSRTGKKLKSRGVKIGDIERVIGEVRASGRSNRSGE